MELELLPGQRATRDIKTKSGEVIVKKNRKFTRGAIKKLEAAKMTHAAHRRRRALHQGLRLRRGGRGHRRGDPRVQRGGHPGEGGRAPQARHQGVQGPLHRQPQRGSVPARDVDAGQDRHARAGDHGDLPAAAPGRSPDARDGDQPLHQPLLQPRALRPLEGRPPQAELQVRPRGAARRADPHQARHPRGHPLPDRPQERQRDHRRHRPPRQPPRPRGGRAAREPVPHRSRAHGAGDQGAHESAGDRDAHAARPDQRQAGHGGDQGVLRAPASSRSSWTRRTPCPR